MLRLSVWGLWLNSNIALFEDKGKNLIGLLTGPPGIIKTLIAEAVAEVSRRPLYMVTSAEFGKYNYLLHLLEIMTDSMKVTVPLVSASKLR